MPHGRAVVVLIAAALIALFSDGAQAAPVAPPTNLPEPASLGLFAVGAAALACVKFRRRK